MRKRKSSWNNYLAKGTEGYYIQGIYGPFKTKKAAEFFNFIAFGVPRSLDASKQAKENIVYLKKAGRHPKEMFRANSSFSVWWEDIFGVPLTLTAIMDLAYECKAEGYHSFIQWLIRGSMINGKRPHDQYSSTLGHFN